MPEETPFIPSLGELGCEGGVLDAVEAGPRVGVFICECGQEIAGVLDVEDLAGSARSRADVAWAGHAPYWCSADGRRRMQETIAAEGLNRVVVAGCSARTHRKLFRETLRGAEANPELVGITNIREGCAYPHRDDPDTAATRASAQIAMEVAHLRALTPRAPVEAVIHPEALVIGGGVAGMTAALELAYSGTAVTLLERSEALGGTAAEDAPETASALADAVEAQSDITVKLEARIAEIDGTIGSYRASLSNGGAPDAPDSVTLQAPASAALGPFGVVIVATGAPADNGASNAELAEMLRLPQDADGFITDLRVRLRSERFLDRGVYVCGSAHYPCDPTMAQFQAFSAASRALAHLNKRSVTLSGPGAVVDPERCNGCGDCYRACPFAAITMVERTTEPGASVEKMEEMSLSIIDPLLCTGCGNCVSVCPVEAATLTGWSDEQLEAQMRVALNGQLPTSHGTAPDLSAAVVPQSNGDREPRVLVFACEWSGHAALELAGAQQRSYPANVRVIRLDCTGRLQSGLLLNAFEMGADGVLVLGCRRKLCHYERGNERAAAAFEQAHELTTMLGMDPARLRLEWSPPDDGAAVADLITEFVRGVEKAVAAVV